MDAARELAQLLERVGELRRCACSSSSPRRGSPSASLRSASRSSSESATSRCCAPSCRLRSSRRRSSSPACDDAGARVGQLLARLGVGQRQRRRAPRSRRSAARIPRGTASPRRSRRAPRPTAARRARSASRPLERKPSSRSSSAVEPGVSSSRPRAPAGRCRGSSAADGRRRRAPRACPPARCARRRCSSRRPRPPSPSGSKRTMFAVCAPSRRPSSSVTTSNTRAWSASLRDRRSPPAAARPARRPTCAAPARRAGARSRRAGSP